jgi:hypothetical protein
MNTLVLIIAHTSIRSYNFVGTRFRQSDPLGAPAIPDLIESLLVVKVHTQARAQGRPEWPKQNSKYKQQQKHRFRFSASTQQHRMEHQQYPTGNEEGQRLCKPTSKKSFIVYMY